MKMQGLSRILENIEMIKREVSPTEKSREKAGSAARRGAIGLRTCGHTQEF